MNCFALLFCLLLISPIRTLVCPDHEIKILQSFYDGNNGDHWKWQYPEQDYGKIWNFSGSNVNPCNGWQGISCYAINDNDYGINDGNIRVIRLIGFNITNKFPVQLTNLSSLHNIIFSGNELTGSLPEELCNMSSLQFLILDYNHFTGRIPECLHQMPNLFSINLGFNHLHGEIPPFISNINYSLILLGLAGNAFSGPLVGKGIPNLAKLQVFIVNDNFLTGKIDVLFEINTLYALVVANNQFTGTIPDLFDQTIGMEYVLCDRNYFHGNIPTTLFMTPSLLYASLFSNEFTGEIPDTLVYAPSLRRIAVYDNHLTGTLPDDIGYLQNLEELNIYQNFLSGTIPMTVSNLSYLKTLLVQQNSFIGSISGAFNRSTQPLLKTVNIADNHFTGGLPEEAFGASLTTFCAYDLCFSDAIPSAICQAKKLTTLVLDGLNAKCAKKIWPLIPGSPRYSLPIPGGIPDCLFSDLPELVTLHIAGNGLEDDLPNLDDYQKLQDVDLSHNSLYGIIPHRLQSKADLTKLNLASNKFSGTIDSNINSNVSFVLKLSSNRLSGLIPTELRAINDIKILAGNLFDCDNANHRLPENDPNSHSYTCGSHNLDYSLMVLGIVLTCIGACVLVGKGVQSSFFLRKICKHFIFMFRKSNLQELIDEYNQLVIHATDLNIDINSQTQFSYILYSKKATIELFQNHLISSIHREFLAEDKLLDRGKGEESTSFVRFLQSNRLLREVSAVLAILQNTVYLVVYIILKYGSTYKTFTYQYSWRISGAFLSGSVPAAVTVILWTCSITIVYFMIYNGLKQRFTNQDSSTNNQIDKEIFESDRNAKNALERPSMIELVSTVDVESHAHNQPTATSETNEQTASNKNIFAKAQIIAFVFVVNAIIIVTLKAVFVYTILYDSNSYRVKLLEAVLLSAVDIIWNACIVPWLINQTITCWHRGREDLILQNSQQTILKVSLLYFNSIVAASIAVMITDENCMQGLFISAEKVSEDFSVNYCLVYTSADDKCFNSLTTTISRDYTPSYIYNYNCYSSIITAFTPIFFIQYALLALVTPMLATFIVMNNHRKESVTMQLILKAAPEIYAFTWKEDIVIQNCVNPIVVGKNIDEKDEIATTQSDSKHRNQHQHQHDKLFNAGFVLAVSLHHLLVILTFGIIFPPLSLAAAMVISISTYHWEILIGRYLRIGHRWDMLKAISKYDLEKVLAENSNSVLIRLDQVCRDAHLNLSYITILVGCGSAVFMGMIALDISGDEIGWERSIWTIFATLMYCMILISIEPARKYLHNPSR